MKGYEKPVVEFVEFEECDIITTSGEGTSSGSPYYENELQLVPFGDTYDGVFD